jgi:hypothetical protein
VAYDTYKARGRKQHNDKLVEAVEKACGVVREMPLAIRKMIEDRCVAPQHQNFTLPLTLKNASKP